MIPRINADLILPPVTSVGPGTGTVRSPYSASISEVVQRFSTTIERAAILRGLLTYRQAVIGLGMTDGHMWLDGSFVENIEAKAKRPPNDIDLVTFAVIPAGSLAEKDELRKRVPEVFDPDEAKRRFRCDAHFVDLAEPLSMILKNTCYWYGLFSHQRDSNRWKGMLQVPLLSDDSVAGVILRQAEQSLGG